MKEGFDFRIVLPPRGTLIRELVISTIPLLTDLNEVQDVRYGVMHDEVVLKFVTREAVDYVFRMFYDAVIDVIKRKLYVKIRDRGLHRNDAQWLNELVGSQSGYLSAALSFIEKFEDDFEPFSLSRKTVKRSGEIYGFVDGNTHTYPLIQPLKVEKYEYDGDWMSVVGGGVKRVTRFDKNWYMLLLAGYGLTYAGMVEDELMFIYPDEHWVMEYVAEGQKFWMPHVQIAGKFGRFLFDPDSGIISRMAELRVPVEPKTAYLLYVASNLTLAYETRVSLLKKLRIGVARIAGGGRTYTLIEKINADLAPLLSMITKLYLIDKTAVICLESISRKTIIYRLNRNLNLYGDYHTFTSHFYEYLHHAYDLYTLIYEAARSKIGERESKCIQKILEAVIRLDKIKPKR